MQINVVYQFNENYVPYAGVSITSLLENNKNAEKIDIYILGEELTDSSIEKLRLSAANYGRNIIFKDTREIIDKMKEWGLPSYRGAYSANLRLFLPMILGKTDLRILYLDADTIVNRSIEELIEIDMDNYSIAMVLDSLGRNYKTIVGLKENEFYYNSGVVLFDMKNWINHRCTERIISYLKKGGKSWSSPDQNLLNVVCKNEIMRISPAYNLQPVHLVFDIKDYYRCYGKIAYYNREQLENAVNQPVIYHFYRFLGQFPWHLNNLHPGKTLFARYLSMSPWKDYKCRKADEGMIMGVQRLLFRLLPRGMFLRIFSICHDIYIEKSKETA